MNNLELWQSVLAQMQFHISKANFATWFQNVKKSANRLSLLFGIQVFAAAMSMSLVFLLPDILISYNSAVVNIYL